MRERCLVELLDKIEQSLTEPTRELVVHPEQLLLLVETVSDQRVKAVAPHIEAVVGVILSPYFKPDVVVKQPPVLQVLWEWWEPNVV